MSGHCGTINQLGTDVDNDASLTNIETIALSHAEAGADVLTPSSMMDGQVHVVKNSLKENGFHKVKIMSFAAKYASSLYSLFRTTAFSNFQLNDKINKSTYQVSCSNFRESLNEIQMDLNEGADIIMIKPSMGTLDLIAEVKRRFCCPLAVQNVSGEYLMIKTASDRGLINEDEWIFGYVIGMKRAGADLIMSYSLDRIIRHLYLQRTQLACNNQDIFFLKSNCEECHSFYLFSEIILSTCSAPYWRLALLVLFLFVSLSF